jgi:hypothetical protein
MNNVMQGATLNYGQKRPSNSVEQTLSFDKQVLNCVLLSQVVILLEDEAAYDESLKSDLTCVRLHANGQDYIYFSKTAFWPRAATSDVEGKFSVALSHSLYNPMLISISFFLFGLVCNMLTP